MTIYQLAGIPYLWDPSICALVKAARRKPSPGQMSLFEGDPDFEQKHPRGQAGKFSQKGGSPLPVLEAAPVDKVAPGDPKGGEMKDSERGEKSERVGNFDSKLNRLSQLWQQAKPFDGHLNQPGHRWVSGEQYKKQFPYFSDVGMVNSADYPYSIHDIGAGYLIMDRRVADQASSTAPDTETAEVKQESRDPKPRNKPPFPGAMMTSTGDWVTPDEWDEIEGNM